MLTFALSRPLPPQSRRVQVRRKLKQAIKYAQVLCPNFEDTIECRIAWDTVNDLTRALHKQVPDETPIEVRDLDEELSQRIYDM
jgi:hypothetical protein